MQSARSSDPETGGSTKPAAKPAWLAPVVVLVIILALFAGSRKREEVVQNPLVELAILTVGVLAMSAALAVVASKLGSPGAAAFFGRTYTHNNATHDVGSYT